MGNKIVLCSYEPEWNEIYKKEAKVIRAVLGNKVRVYHVGSTAVKGMCAQPAIDILLVVKSFAEFDKSAVCAIEYSEMGAGDSDVLMFNKNEEFPFSLIVIERTNADKIQKILTVRDFLRADSKEAEAYSSEKKRIAELVNGDEPYDFRDYSHQKSEYLDALAKRAQEWCERENRRSTRMALGMCWGMSAGMLLGVAVDNIPLWMSLGISIGMCLGLSLGGEAKK